MPFSEKARFLERHPEGILETVRVIPLQLQPTDLIRNSLTAQKRGGTFAPWNIPLTQTYLLLKGDASRTQDVITCIGGEVPFQENNPAEPRVSKEEAVLRKLAQVAHAHGIHDTDVHKLRDRKPYSFRDSRGEIFCFDTVFSAEMPVGFVPRAIDVNSPYHEFLPATPREVKDIFEREQLQLSDGRHFELIGNLRNSQKHRLRDHFLQANTEDVKTTKETIQMALDRYEASMRQSVALELFHIISSRNIFIPNSESLEKNLAHYKLTNALSIEQFNLHYKNFLSLFYRSYLDKTMKYIDSLTHNQSYRQSILGDIGEAQFDAYKQRASEQAQIIAMNNFTHLFCKAVDYVATQKTIAFNKRLPVQGALLQLYFPKSLNQISMRNVEHVIADPDRMRQLKLEGTTTIPATSQRRKEIEENPEYFSKFLQFAFEAMQATSLNDLYFKLRSYKQLKHFQRHLSHHTSISDTELSALILFEDIQKRIYQTFARYFIPNHKSASLNSIKEEYAYLSQQSDDFYTEFATGEPSRGLASDDSYRYALAQSEDVAVDQLDEHLLGSFAINPYSSGPEILSEQEGYEFRRKLMSIMILSSEVSPHYKKMLAENTFFIRDVLKNFLRDGEKEHAVNICFDKQNDMILLRPREGEKMHRKYEVITNATTIPTRLTIDGEPVDFNLIYRFRKKDEMRLFAKAIERDERPNSIFDVTGFTLIIDEDSIQYPSGSEKKKREFHSKLVHQLELQFERKAIQLGYKYEILDDSRHKRKDLLSGTKAVGGSGASKPLRILKLYPVLSVRTPLSNVSQTQELQLFPDKRAWLEDWQDYLVRYSKERAITPKYKTSIVSRVSHMTYPTAYVLYPPTIRDYAPSYVDLTVGKIPQAPISRIRHMIIAALRRLTEFLEPSRNKV